MPSIGVVRKPLSVRTRSRRAPEDHLIARYPRLYGLLARSLSRLGPESRIRQALIWRTAELSLAATNRRDFDAVLPRYDPDVEFVPAPELVAVGIAPRYRGYAGFQEHYTKPAEALKAAKLERGVETGVLAGAPLPEGRGT